MRLIDYRNRFKGSHENIYAQTDGFNLDIFSKHTVFLSRTNINQCENTRIFLNIFEGY